jgi:DNA-binding transcriptional ArsR family regulator
MPNQPLALDRVFRALGDATRMAVIERLGQGPASASDLAKPFVMAFPSFTQHLNLLESSGLVTSQKIGRSRLYSLQQQRLDTATSWLEQQRTHWNQRLDQLDAFLLATQDTTP